MLVQQMKSSGSSTLGKRTQKMRVARFDTRFSDKQEYYSVKTGVLDYLGDEIILTVFPDKHTVTDEGYTEYTLSGEKRPYRLSKAQALIDAHQVKMANTYRQELYLTYEGDKWEDAVNRLVACIVDVYSIINI